MEIIVVNIKSLLLTLGKLRFASPGDLGLKNTPFWGLFLMFVKNAILYVVIEVFYGAEFKFTGPNT